jgi:multidrug efflux pump subunit AcrA (membrane-fusion protein)
VRARRRPPGARVIYRYHHPLENAAGYKQRLSEIDEQISGMVKRGEAVLASDMFTFNNSLAKGRKMTAEFSRLMLRAYNAEADNCVRALRAGNVLTAKKRLEASVTAIAKLGSMMEMRINPDFHQLRELELELTADYLMKAQEEKEAAREERERLREERKAEQELAAERELLERERTHYTNALEALRASADEVAMAELVSRIEGIDQAIKHNDFRVANIRAGYVYVISNTGSFGPNMVKIMRASS